MIYLLLAVPGLCCCTDFSLVVKRGAILCCIVQASHGGDLPCCGDRALGHGGSVVAAPGLESTGSVVVGYKLSWLHGMWDLPSPGIEPVSPTLAGGFFTTEPPGAPFHFCLLIITLICPTSWCSLRLHGLTSRALVFWKCPFPLRNIDCVIFLQALARYFSYLTSFSHIPY